LREYCLLQHAEGNVKGTIRRRRKREQLLDALEEREGAGNLKKKQ
jgi:hypothetical protein